MTIQELYAAIGGSYESAKRVMQLDKLISKFIIKFADDASFAQLRDGWSARDEQAAFDGAHALKGVCANLGLDDMSAAASELAEEFRPGNRRMLDDDTVQEKIDSLGAIHTRAVKAIREYEKTLP
ncbi:MAG: Hpt domain-containing protein [Oscillospiraceae bacterium]|nr:Hpt domain-containing protein [Oscillospiraceae bacterium]